MRPVRKAALAAVGLAVMLTPAAALASAPSGSQGASKSASKPSQPGPKASLGAKAKAYGRYCRTESKIHTAGQPGTPFSQCVTAMAKLATGTTSSPKVACVGLSKKQVRGQKGTPYSQCLTAGAKLLKQGTSQG
jgi:hypothetical protein